jgi:integrase/recombinase XerC
VDIKDQFLNSIANRHTARAREKDLDAFETGMKVTLSKFLNLPQEDAVNLLREYAQLLYEENRSVATMNRRLASIRALVRFAKTLGMTRLDEARLIGDLYTESSSPARLDRTTCQELILRPDITTLAGARDHALLRLLCEVPLLGWQIHLLRIASFEADSGRLQVPLMNEAAVDESSAREDVAQLQTMEWVELSTETAEGIQNYLQQSAQDADKEKALFRSIDRRPYNTDSPLAPGSILRLVKSYGQQIGISVLNTRILHNSAIMNALIENNGDIKRVGQRFPHINLWTWERHYNQNKSLFKKTRE